jgi:hypothetical protein
MWVGGAMLGKREKKERSLLITETIVSLEKCHVTQVPDPTKVLYL